MARKISSRLKIEGTLIAQTPVHVGGFGESPGTDLPLAQNGKGEWYVPGTSLAGALRSWCVKNFGKALTEKLFGPKHSKGDAEGFASFVLIEDATIEKADEILSEIRDGVGIDRFYGAAANKAKFDRAILPRGTRLNFKMTAEIGEEHNAQETKAVIGHLLAALQKETIRFGAARTRGLGRVKLMGKKKEKGELENEPEIKEQSLIGFENILSLLSGNSVMRSIQDLKDAASFSPNSWPRLDIAVHWQPRLPVMVKAGYDGIGVDMLPLTSSVDTDELALCLPGSSIKGALRSHAERIVRTLLSSESTKGKDFHDQIKALPLIDELFGAKKEKDTQNERLGLGALAIDDCYAAEKMNADTWRKVELARDNKPKDAAKGSHPDAKGTDENQSGQGEVSYFKRELWQYLREIDERTSNLSDAEYAKDTNRFRINHHVAIDRWTGGASEGALYSVLAPTKVDWEAMRLTLDFGRIEEEARLAALMLLLLTLRDVAENRLPFGFATTRGMGEIELKSFDFIGSGKVKVKKILKQNGEIVEQAEDIEIDLKDALSAVVEKGTCKFVDSELKEQAQMRWGKWLKQNQTS
ncbi:MAG TPA: RAMP superfamily CRISPR-associated protein [Pyrinomonadaceae bacterium]|jgi:CRISPR/Cas system CSM-associated protein Csm3 (group 7 of RAMP superfamily)